MHWKTIFYKCVFYILFFQMRDLRSSQFLHCKCAFEKSEIANIGSQEPFYVVYNSSFVQTISG